MVILYENIRLPALVYPWSGDRRHLQATLAAFKWLDDNHMLPYGVPSGEEYASGVGAFRKTETCDVTAMLLATSWMYRIQGNGDWGDRMERAFFNAGAAPIARDFQTMCYYQSPNRLRSDSLPCEQPNCPGPEGDSLSPSGLSLGPVLCRRRQSYHPQLHHSHVDGNSRQRAGGDPLRPLHGIGFGGAADAGEGDHDHGLSVWRDDPHQGGAGRRRWSSRSTSAFPAGANRRSIAVNGAPLPGTPDDKGFVKIARTWSKGDVVELEFPMEPRVVRGFETEFPAANRDYFAFEPAAVFQPRRLPYASVLYGPLLFALPIPDVDPNTPVKDAKWQYALDTDASQRDAGMQVERKPMPPHWDWPLDAPVVLTAPAQAFDWKPTDAQALPNKPVTGTASETIRLVPYGCTKFRISMFPVTPKVRDNVAKTE